MITLSSKILVVDPFGKEERAAGLTAPRRPDRKWCSLRIPLVGDGRRCPVELRQMDGERLVVGPGLVLEEAERDGPSQGQRHVGCAAPVDTGRGSITERN